MKGSLTLVQLAGFATAVAFAFGMVVAPPVVADDDDSSSVFTDESLEGTWGFSLGGTILPPALPVATPSVAVGVITFDGLRADRLDAACELVNELGRLQLGTDETDCLVHT